MFNPLYTPIHHYTPLYTPIYPRHTPIHANTPLYTPKHSYTSIYTPIHSSTPLNTPIQSLCTLIPTTIPTAIPTVYPTAAPTATPTAIPTVAPTATSTAIPTAAPSAVPSTVPTAVPSAVPSTVPTAVPSAVPSTVPSAVPTTYVGEFCLAGVLDTVYEGTGCCAASCGVCGGENCHLRPGGATNCYRSAITEPCVDGYQTVCRVPQSTAPTAASSEYDCTGPFDAATYSTCESKIAYAMDVRPDSWFTKRSLSTSPRDRCEVQEYWAGQSECPSIPTAAP